MGAVTRQIDLICGGILAKIRAAATVQNGGYLVPPRYRWPATERDDRAAPGGRCHPLPVVHWLPAGFGDRRRDSR
jgi:hypothetical protein